MWELDHKESWVPKNWCFWTVVLEKTLEGPLDCKEIQPVHTKGDQPWTFIVRTNAEAETPILWPLDAKSWLIRKDPDAGKDRRQEEKGTTEDEMVGWHQWLNGREFEQALGDGEELGSLACCSPWGRKELNLTAQLQCEILVPRPEIEPMSLALEGKFLTTGPWGKPWSRFIINSLQLGIHSSCHTLFHECLFLFFCAPTWSFGSTVRKGLGLRSRNHQLTFWKVSSDNPSPHNVSL